MLTAPVYWPWWLTGAVLGSLAVGFWLTCARPLGLSGILARFATLRSALRAERSAPPAMSQAELEAALTAATLEAFGREEMQRAAAAPVAEPPAGRALGPVPTLGVHAAFLAAVVAGGLASRLLDGRWRLEPGLGDEFARAVGGGWRTFAALALGGVLVGLGTSLCGGCSAGHGLTGCSKLQPGSLLATACFAAAAIATTLAMGRGAAG